MAWAAAGMTALSMAKAEHDAKDARESLLIQGGYQASIERNNARFAEIEKEDAKARGRFQAEQVQTQTSQMIGSQRAAFAANGIVVDEGTAGETTVQTKMLGKLDELMVRHNASMEAAKSEMDKQNYLSNAALTEVGFQALGIAEKQKADATMIAGASRIASTWATYHQNHQAAAQSNYYVDTGKGNFSGGAADNTYGPDGTYAAPG